MVDELFRELAALDQVEAIALGGSRAGVNFDEKSDYDVYLYVTQPVPEEIRKELLGRYCSYMEIGNHYWEYEDNCVLNDGVDIDILYRDLDSFCEDVADVVERCHPRNGYTTCMWHNLLTCKVLYDRDGRLAQAKKRFDVAYPEQLRTNIIDRNLDLLCDAMPAYRYQIEKAASRNDRVSVVHRTAAFMESYFDVIFAVNRLTHPGEKRLMSLCKQYCAILPERFEENLDALFDDMLTRPEKLKEDIESILSALKAIL